MNENILFDQDLARRDEGPDYWKGLSRRWVRLADHFLARAVDMPEESAAHADMVEQVQDCLRQALDCENRAGKAVS